jgi:uncharacterized protein DUF4160
MKLGNHSRSIGPRCEKTTTDRPLPADMFIDAMPTVDGIPGPYRFFFYSYDCQEPPHVHVQRDHRTSKWWLGRLELARNNGFAAAELRRIQSAILEHRVRILEEWHEHCRRSRWSANPIGRGGR